MTSANSAALLSNVDRQLLERLVVTEQWAAQTKLDACDPRDRQERATALRVAGQGASHPALAVRARNLFAFLRADFRQPFGDLEGISATDAAFIVPLAHAANEGSQVEGPALAAWAKALRPGIPSTVWSAAERELLDLAAIRCGPVAPETRRSPLEVEYRALSRHIGILRRRIRGLAAPVTRPPRILRDAVASAEHSLQRYANTVQTLPSGDYELRLARLPPELFDRRLAAPSGQVVLRRVRAVRSRSTWTVEDLTGAVFPGRALDTTLLVLVSELLERCGIGFEPDPRYLAPVPSPEMHVRTFEWSLRRERPSPAFVSAVALLQISAAIAFADGRIDDSERDQLRTELDHTAGLEPAERQRLAVRIAAMLDEPPDLSELVERMRQLRGSARELVAEVLVRMAASDGEISAEEYELLLRAYRAMRLTKTHLNDALHRMAPRVPVDSSLGYRQREPRDRRSELGKDQDEERYNALTTLLMGDEVSSVNV